MHNWMASKSGSIHLITRTYAHTPRKNSEQTPTTDADIALGDSLALIRSLPGARLALEQLVSECPILGKRSRFRRCDGTWGHISNLDVVLLLAAGYYHREIAEYLQTRRLNVTRAVMKIDAAMEHVHNSQRPYQANGATQEKPEDYNVPKIISTLLGICDDGEKPLPQNVIRQIQSLLTDETHRTIRRYERKTISVGAGKFAEDLLDELTHTDFEAGKVTEKRVRTRHKSRYNADKLLLHYWKGKGG